MPLYELGGKRPTIDSTAYIAPTAVLIGDVRVGPRASVWFGAVLRGDESHIEVGAGANIQDGAVVHCSHNLPTVIGDNATLGHLACIEGCVVGAGSVVGTAATMLHLSRLEEGSLLAAGSVLAEGQVVPSGHLAAGVPAKVKKKLEGSSLRWLSAPAPHYQENGVLYRRELRPLEG